MLLIKLRRSIEFIGEVDHLKYKILILATISCKKNITICVFFSFQDFNDDVVSHGALVEKVKDTGEDLTDAQPQIKPRISKATGKWESVIFTFYTILPHYNIVHGDDLAINAKREVHRLPPGTPCREQIGDLSKLPVMNDATYQIKRLSNPFSFVHVGKTPLIGPLGTVRLWVWWWFHVTLALIFWSRYWRKLTNLTLCTRCWGPSRWTAIT